MLVSTLRRVAVLTALWASVGTALVFAAPPYDLPTLKSSAPNYNRFYTNVLIGSTSVPTDDFRTGDEILNGVLAYLCPTSPVYNNTAYRDRVLFLMDTIASRWNAGTDLAEIGYAWQINYAYLLLKYYRSSELSAARVTAYESALAANHTHVLTVSNALLYDQRLLANLWLNGDIRLAMGVYFGATALANSTNATKAQRAIDEVMSMASLEDGGQRYVGFWGEVSTYHEENIYCFLFWWLITGSTPIKAALDATQYYTPVTVEPVGYTEQSSNIPYKHMYNGIIARNAALWKAYLYDDGYNYFYGKSAETTSSTEILNTILYQPNRTTKTPPTHVGVFFDGNLQGPRGRFNGTWGWIANGRDVQNGGPESQPLITAQGYDGRQCGKSTLVGAFVLGTVANNTALKGALDTVGIEVKESTGVEYDVHRGSKYRYLTQDEKTATITRQGFGTISSSYRISTRTSANASLNWDSSATKWTGQQLWVLTDERMIGLVQIVNTSGTPATAYGLDARLIFTGGRKGIMGSYLTLTRPATVADALGTTAPNDFQFGEIRVKIAGTGAAGDVGTTFNGDITSQRIPIHDNISTDATIAANQDNFSELVRINEAGPTDATPVAFPAGTRRWVVLDVTRNGTAYATSSKFNVLPENNTFAVLQFNEGSRKVRIVQNLTATPQSYSGNFVVGTTYTSTSLHRSWNSTVSALTVTSGTAVVAETIPAYGHVIAVNSNNANDHTSTVLTAKDLFSTYGDLLSLAVGSDATSPGYAAPFTVTSSGNTLRLTFNRVRADCTYYVEGSSDLATWTTVATNPGTLGQSVTVNDTATFAAGSPRFLRLRVTKP
jgi:hypothetical protein